MLESLPRPDAVMRLMDAAEALSGLELRDVAKDGTPDQLADTRAAQPLLYLCDWAWGSAMLEAGMRPAAVAGHSLGELAALAISGAFSVEAGLELVVERSRLMALCAETTPGGMVAVIGMNAADVTSQVGDLRGVWVANDNAPGQVVLSGTHEGLAAASAALAEAGARRLVPLTVSGPFHSPLMEPAAKAFATLLESVTFADATIPVYQNTDPTPAREAAALRARLSAQITSPVRWTGIMRSMMESGVGTMVEAGPGTVLKGLARRIEGLDALSVDEDGLDAVLEVVC